jgi:molybdenum cofactor biosynthesis protein B
LVRDDIKAITDTVLECTRQQPTAILLTGGTGIGPRDVTYEAVTALLDKQIDGFGEHFRNLSIESVGTRALLSRAIAGTVGNALVFAVPGSPRAVELAVSRLVIPLLPHATSMLEGQGHG